MSIQRKLESHVVHRLLLLQLVHRCPALLQILLDQLPLLLLQLYHDGQPRCHKLRPDITAYLESLERIPLAGNCILVLMLCLVQIFRGLVLMLDRFVEGALRLLSRLAPVYQIPVAQRIYCTP